jgi:glycosyltransferase involved in cell wall biosynthesis
MEDLTVVRSGRHTRVDWGGNTRFVLNLYRELSKLGVSEIVLDPPERLISTLPASAVYGVWEATALPRAARRRGADIIHLTSDTGGGVRLGVKTPIVATIHGIASHGAVTTRSPAYEAIWRRRVELTARMSNRITTDSESSADDLSEAFGFDRSRLKVIPLGVNHEYFRPPSDLESANARRTAHELGILGPFGFFFGNVNDPKKNLVGAVAAIRAVRQQIRDLQFVASGAALWRAPWDGFEADWALHVGRVEDAVLRDLMWASEFVLFPSLYEGFGLPALEASTGGSLPEVVGDGALKPDPADIDAIADAIVTVMSDRATRNRLRRLGPERAREFTWSRCAQMYLDEFLIARDG